MLRKKKNILFKTGFLIFFKKESESSLKSGDDHSDNGRERRALTRPDRARRGPYVTKRFFSSEQR